MKCMSYEYNVFNVLLLFYVIVLVPPSFTNTPFNQAVTEEEQTTFTCTAAGNPAPNITWIKDGKTVGTGQTLTLETHRNQYGEYWCSAENGVGLAINASAYLDVQCKCNENFFYFCFLNSLD